jgi:hypothetical protein
MRTLVVVAVDEVVELGLLEEVVGRGLGRLLRSWRPFCCGWLGRMRSRWMPSGSHHTESLLKPKSAYRRAKGTPSSVRMA